MNGHWAMGIGQGNRDEGRMALGNGQWAIERRKA